MRIEVVLTLPRDAASIPLARHAVSTVLEHAGVVEDCVAEVEVALSEACTNAYLHAREGVSFELRTCVGSETLTIEVLDSGTGFVGRGSAPGMPSPSSAGGRGMALMAAFSDKAVFDAVTHDGGSVRLVKHLRWSDDAPLRGHLSPGNSAAIRSTLRAVRSDVPRQR
jgi:serine/threonine-protein kinase RsbW